ncbi:MAG TPA: CoA pyrophosphatase [Actinomycetota bacterium]|nr:CoA pyrophosphatase [Actinomycetota bacterium]
MSETFEGLLLGALSARAPRRARIEGARDAAVLVPVVLTPEPSLIFTVRTEHLPSHKGQISFPGGSIGPGESAVEAALREAQEEIGLDPDEVRVIGELDSMPTFVSGFVVSPVVGLIDRLPQLHANPSEVAEILVVPIAQLNEEIRSEPGFSHLDRTYPTEAWVWGNHVIWGVTARLLRTFLILLADLGLAARPGETISWGEWPVQASERR